MEQFFSFQWVDRHPQTDARVVVAGTVVVHTCLLVELFRVEKIWCVPYVVALLDEDLSEGHILDVLHDLTVKVGDEAGAAEMVGMVEELQVLVVVGVFERPRNRADLCLPSLSNRRLHRAVVAAEAFAVGIVVVVNAVVRYIKELVVVLDDLLLGCIFRLVINRKTVGIRPGILYAARIRTVGSEVADFRYNSLRTCVDMLCVTTALICHEIRAYIEGEFSGVGRAAGENSVDIDLIALAGGFHSAFSVGIIPVVGHEAIVVHCKQTILLIPDELALSDTVVPMSVSHNPVGVYIDKVSVLVVGVNAAVLDIVVAGSLLSTVINILYTFELEFLPFFRAVGISEVITDIESAVELHIVLSQMLAL